jgi:hypothetical protein
VYSGAGDAADQPIQDQGEVAHGKKYLKPSICSIAHDNAKEKNHLIEAEDKE